MLQMLGDAVRKTFIIRLASFLPRSRLIALIAPAADMGVALLLAAALFAAPCLAQYVDAPTPDDFVSEYGTAAYAYQPSLSNNTATTVKICIWSYAAHDLVT